MLFPKPGIEGHEQSENFETPDEHQRRSEPFCGIRHRRPGICRTVGTERGARVAHCRNGGAECLHEGQAHGHEQKPAEENADEEAEHENKHGGNDARFHDVARYL